MSTFGHLLGKKGGTRLLQACTISVPDKLLKSSLVPTIAVELAEGVMSDAN